MKKIGFVDYFLDEWHANSYPEFIANVLKETGDDFEIAYAWAEAYESPKGGMNTDQWCEKFGVEKCETIDELCQKSDYIFILSPDNPEKHLEYAKAVLLLLWAHATKTEKVNLPLLLQTSLEIL